MTLASLLFLYFILFLVLGHKNAVPDLDGDQVFPESDDDVNGTFTSIPAQIMIPRSFLREQMRTNRKCVCVSVLSVCLYAHVCVCLCVCVCTRICSCMHVCHVRMLLYVLIEIELIN